MKVCATVLISILTATALAQAPISNQSNPAWFPPARPAIAPVEPPIAPVRPPIAPVQPPLAPARPLRDADITHTPPDFDPHIALDSERHPDLHESFGDMEDDDEGLRE